jgi:hypothetical protein
MALLVGGAFSAIVAREDFCITELLDKPDPSIKTDVCAQVDAGER